MRQGCLLPALLLAFSGLALAATPPHSTSSHKPARHPTTAPARAAKASAQGPTTAPVFTATPGREDETVLSTADLLRQSAWDLEDSDKEMNRAYQQLLSMLDKEGKEKLKSAQRAWLKYRDAQAGFDADAMRGGSAAGVLDLGARLELTEARTQDLEDAIEARR